MQALPFATQLLSRLGAEVVKVEHPVTGESGRGAMPAIKDPDGRNVGATFLRNNLNKRSVGLDLKDPRGRELFIRLAAGFDVVAENFKAGTMERLGLGFDELSAIYPRMIYVSVSGFGDRGESPYRSWPAYAIVPEAMSGLYEYARSGDEPPRVIPAGALGDISSALFAVIGIQAALRHRDRI
ncbi:MAG: CoA transferase, partial [Microthrixaceae bacterium]|nr:CoA transferase [Microthrixaceae bacterium]